jgi:exocyst complex protein 7
MEVSAAAELEAAERVVMRWDSTALVGGGATGDEWVMLFDGAGDRTEAERFELCHVLAARTLDLEIEALAGLTSLSMAGDQRNSDATDAAGGDEDGGGFGRARRRRRRRRSIRVVAASCRLLRGRHLQTAASSPSTSCCCTPLGCSTK